VADVEWSDLKILLALSRAGSVAGAARALGVDQSTVSRRLAALEESLAARLIVRGGREFSLTAEGRAMCKAAETVDVAVAEAVREVRVSKLDVAGTVRVSCPPAFVPHLIKALAAVRDRYPALVGEISGAYRTIDLAKGEADIALRAFKPTEPDLVARVLCKCDWAVYVSDAYAAEHGVPATFDDLPKHALVTYAPTMHSVPGLRWMDDHRGGATRISRVDNLELAVQLVAADAGCAAIPTFMAEPMRLRRAFPAPVWFNEIFCVYHASTRDAARVRAAVDTFVAYFDAHAALFAT
jgi:DNA-binding transcriptional LysR family regulator